MGNQFNPIIQKSSAVLFSHSFTGHNKHVFVVVETLITHPFVGYFPHRPSAAVARHIAGSLAKALDVML